MDIKAHRLFPFSHWRDSDEEWAMMKAYWHTLFETLVEGAGWQEWFEPQRDGNPVLSLAHHGKGRSLRVILADAPEANGGWAQPFLSHLPADITGLASDFLDLAIVGTVSPHSEAACHLLWKPFCRDVAPESVIESMIVAYETAAERYRSGT